MFSWVGTLLEGKIGEDVAEANARIAKQRAQAQAQSITMERERLADAQRGMKAKQRMSVASRGGMMGGTDLLTLAEEAKQMQLDNLEMVRQRDLSMIGGENESTMTMLEGLAKKRAGYWTAGATAAEGASKVASAGVDAGMFGGAGAEATGGL